jgi:hypothetical protein
MRLVCLLAAALAAGPAVAQPLTIGTNPSGSLAYMTGAMIAKVATENAGVQTLVVPHGGPPITLPALNRGEIEMSIAESMTTALGYRGQVMFSQPLTEVRVVAALFPLRVGMFVRADSGIRSIAELKGKRIPAEFPIQRNNHMMIEAALASAGLSYADVKPWPVPDGVRGVDDFIGGKVDATLFSLGSGKVQQASSSVGGIRFLSVNDTPQTRAAMQRITPGLYIETVEPKPSYLGVVEPTNILTAQFLLLTGSKVPDETIYRIAKALAGNKAALAAGMPDFGELSLDNMARDTGVPVHPGAARFYREAGVAPGGQR